MKITTYSLAGAVALALSAGLASASSYNFSYTYDGSSIVQDAGSDTADGTSLVIGDDFTIDVHATAGNAWAVVSDFSDFVPMSYGLTESGDRFVNITTNWLLNGVSQFSQIETSVYQGYVHAGANSWSLSTGLIFDQVILEWELLSVDPVNVGDPTPDTIISEVAPDVFSTFADPDAPFFNEPTAIEFGQIAAVPLPATLPLLAGAIGLMAFARRRRNS